MDHVSVLVQAHGVRAYLWTHGSFYEDCGCLVLLLDTIQGVALLERRQFCPQFQESVIQPPVGLGVNHHFGL